MITLSPMSQNDPLECNSTLDLKGLFLSQGPLLLMNGSDLSHSKVKAGLTKSVPSKGEVGNLQAGSGGKQWAKSTRSNITQHLKQQCSSYPRCFLGMSSAEPIAKVRDGSQQDCRETSPESKQLQPLYISATFSLTWIFSWSFLVLCPVSECLL